MRSLYFTAAESGLTRAQLRHGESVGRWVRLGRGSYRFGADPATELDRCLGPVAAAEAVACGQLAAVLLGFDAVQLAGPELTRPPGSSSGRAGSRRAELPYGTVEVAGFVCTSPLQTLVDLAALLDDLRWEQALESALRKQLVCLVQLETAAEEMGRRRTPGVARIRRVLALRPPGAPPTGSLLETFFVQLVRELPGVAAPRRQVEVRNRHDQFVAFVDFAWPELGIFIELDGQGHRGQPVYDATRETAVVATTGWLVGGFTWDDVVRRPHTTRRRLVELLRQAAARPMVR